MAEWTCIGDEVPGLTGQAFYLAAPSDHDRIENALTAAGFEIRSVVGDGDRNDVVAALGAALGGEASNYDALTDVARDLTGSRVALFWRGAEHLVANDLPAWTTLADLLREASIDHWDPDDDESPDNVVFETVAFVEGFGVHPLP